MWEPMQGRKQEREEGNEGETKRGRREVNK